MPTRMHICGKMLDNVGHKGLTTNWFHVTWFDMTCNLLVFRMFALYFLEAGLYERFTMVQSFYAFDDAYIGPSWIVPYHPRSMCQRCGCKTQWQTTEQGDVCKQDPQYKTLKLQKLCTHSIIGQIPNLSTNMCILYIYIYINVTYIDIHILNTYIMTYTYITTHTYIYIYIYLPVLE